ncbi:MAG: hypothetical protein ACOC1F_00565 [Myxococcota bacterium]
MQRDEVDPQFSALREVDAEVPGSGSVQQVQSEHPRPSRRSHAWRGWSTVVLSVNRGILPGGFLLDVGVGDIGTSVGRLRAAGRVVIAAIAGKMVTNQ